MSIKNPYSLLKEGRKLCVCIFLTMTAYLSFSQNAPTPVISLKHANEEGNETESRFIRQHPALPNDSNRKAGKRIIVEFTGEPLATLYKKDFNKSELEAQIQLFHNKSTKLFDDFQKDLNTLYEDGYLFNNKRYPYLKKPQFGSEYTKTYFGQQLTVDSLMIEKIEKLPYVIAVHPDRIVKATLDESIPQINVDSVWNELGCEGDSITVGILDTGIDYNHPDLGGGFGPGYKVVGGYDYVNLDDDPMDDHFHGTHVAGIVAANGTLRGVAPGALLYALKVLDQVGSGWESDVISAIEYTVDPNNDDDFSDRLDVANMSLGGWASENDPMVDAVEAGIGLGVTYCIAAGNEGNYAGTLGSPGTSPSAITVGAVDKNDSIAEFSSAGPAPYTYILKPDILAPGVDINSTIPGGEYETYDGTSMATPHITGISALLKRLHPDWGPREIKAAIMLAGHDLGKDKILQGSGVADAYRAALINTMIDNPSLNFGMDTLGPEEVWIQTQFVMIKNISSDTLEYSLEIPVSKPGVTFTFSQDSFTLDPGAETKISVTIEVDNSLLEAPAIKGSDMHSGDIILQNKEESVHISWGFIQSFILNIDINGRLFNLGIVNTDNLFWENDLPPSGNMLIRRGEYYVIAQFYDEMYESDYERFTVFVHSTVIKKINIESNLQLVLDESEAVNKIVFATEDENGNRYTDHLSKSRSYCIAFGDSVLFDVRRFTESLKEISFVSGARFYYSKNKICVSTYNNTVATNEDDFLMMDTLYISELPEGARVILGETRRNTLDGYHFCFNNAGPFFDPEGDLMLSSDASNYETIYVEEPCQNCNHMWWPKLFYKSGRITDGSSITYDPYEVNMPWFAVSMPACEDPLEDYYYYFTIKRGSEFYTPPLRFINDQFIFGQGDTPGAVGIEPGDTIVYAMGPWTPQIQSENNGEPYGWYGDESICMYTGNMTGGYNEVVSGIELTGSFTLSDEQGEVVHSGDGLFIYTDQPPGRYNAIAQISRNSPIYGLPVNNTLDTWFDLRLEDPDPPSLVALHVLDTEGNQTHVIKKNDPATILFTASDEVPFSDFEPGGLPVVFDSVEVYAKKHSDSEWIAYAVDSVGYDPRDGLTCQSVITGTDYDTTHFDVKVVCVDEAGNRIESITSPAFYIKNLQVPTAVDDSYSLTVGDYFKPEHPVTINDIDPFGEAADLKAELVSDVTHGQLQYFRQSGTFLYRASSDYTGIDEFTYRVKNEMYRSPVATVTLNITPDAIHEISKPETGNKLWIYPNPASEIVNISFSLEAAGEINIEAYDITGTKLATIFDGLLDGGEHTLLWDLADREPFRLLPGMYYISLRTESFYEIQKVIIK